jgi:hypothetical protein
MKDNKNINVKINNNIRSTVIFENPPSDYWTQIKEYTPYRSIIDIDQKVLNTIAEVVEDTNTEYKIMFMNGQSGWIWKDNCVEINKIS